MNSEMRIKVLVALAALLTGTPTLDGVSEQLVNLATPESFASIADTAARSAAMFTELGKVLTHPRCVNCHPAGDHPHQGKLGRLHQPPVQRGIDGHGAAAMRCSICHQNANFDPGRVPGHPEWHLAPREMAAARSKTSSTTLARTRWSAGPGRPAMDARPLRARRRTPARWSKPG